MADVITRLKLESGEYDSKIQRAVSGLKRMEEECRNVGGTLAILEKDQKDYVQSLGQMQTVSNSVRGKINELSNAYMELRSQYNRLTEEEKKGDFGKALSSSLDQLKQRIDESKAELAGINSELNNTSSKGQEAGSMLDQLAQKFTINIDALKLFEIGLKAANVALDVAKDAFFASEANVDEWGRTVQSAQSVYEGFLTAINNGDISGYLNNIDNIVKAARLAHDELDKLGTLKTIQAPQISKQQTENDRIRMMIQTGRYIAPQDGRRAATVDGREMKTGDRLTAAQIRALENSLQGGMQKMVNLVGNEVEQTGRAIDAYYDKLAKTNGMSLQEFKKGTSSWDEFSKRIKGYDDYKRFESEHTSTVEQWNPHTMQYETKFTRDEVRNPYQQYANWGTFRVDKEGDNSFKDLVNLIKQRDQQIGQVYSTQGQAYRAMNRAEGFTVRQLLGGGGGGTTPRTTTTKVTLTEEEKAAKALAEAERKRAEQLNKLNEAGLNAVRDNNLGQAFKVQREGLSMGLGAELTQIPVTFTYSQDNMAALMSSIKADLSASELGSDMFNALTEQLNDASSLSNLISYALKNGIEASDLSEASNVLFQQLLGEGDIPDEALESLKNAIGETLGKSLNLSEDGGLSENKKEDNKEWEGFQKSIGNLSNAMSGLTTITSGLQAIGIKIDGDFANFLSGLQGAISIIQGVITIINALSVPAETANTVATYANTAAIGSLAAALHSNTISRWIKPWAEGGVVHAAMGITVPGNNFSGDLVPAMVNSGELILNKAQQGNLLAQMEGGGMRNLHLTTEVSGDNLRIILQNNNELHGYGEVFTFNM